MRKYYPGMLFGVGIIMTLLLGGCAAPNSPQGVVLRFITAVKGPDTAEFENTLSFERLIIEKEGEGYTSLSPEAKARALTRFKENMLASLTSGELRHLGDIDPKVRNERISGGKAEVVIYDRKNKDKSYLFALARKNGVWKIYRISEL